MGQEARIYVFILILFPSWWLPMQIVEGWLEHGKPQKPNPFKDGPLAFLSALGVLEFIVLKSHLFPEPCPQD